MGLEKCAKNETYTTPEIQDEIADICDKAIQTKIFKIYFFLILADITKDVSSIEQFASCTRYINDFNYKTVERFLKLFTNKRKNYLPKCKYLKTSARAFPSVHSH